MGGGMKVLLALVGLALGGAVAATAQETNLQPLQVQGSLRYELPTKTRPLTLVLTPERPNEIVGPRFSYSGILVQLFKTRNPLELINPFAPAQYGLASDNTAWNVIDGTPAGLKIFSIGF
jgi:hypothetical protein